MNSQSRFSRRNLIKTGLSAGALMPLMGLLATTGARGAALVALEPTDPVAKALGYVVKSVKPGQQCSGCVQFVGKVGDAVGGCNIFPGKQVAGEGWCLSYVKKP